jgi:voltage-gated potassium channel
MGDKRTGEIFGPYDAFMLALSVCVLGALAVEVLAPIDAATRKILDVADSAFCVVFLADFVVSIARAPNRWWYLTRWGWIDLASSIPALDAMRWGRAARALRILRLLRAVRSTKILADFILRRRGESAFLAASLVSILLVISASIAILQVEPAAEGNIKTAEDALWWAVTTVTTVGYGDRFPVTTEGRIVGAVLMTTGVGLFGIFTGFVASWFVASDDARAKGFDELRAEMEEIRRLLNRREEGGKTS